MLNTPDAKSAPAKELLLFFNYHEYLVSDFQPIGKDVEDHPSLVINHFPHPHKTNTRVFRVPRAYHTTKYSDLVPQFSPCVPGTEAAALKDGTGTFHPRGTYQGGIYGYTSATPLVPGILSEKEYVDLIGTINQRLEEALDPKGWIHILEGVADAFSLGLYRYLWCKFVRQSHSKRLLLSLEEYIGEKNEEWRGRGVGVCSLRETGYVSLDIQYTAQ